MEADGVSVGGAAKETGLSPKALRLYEELGIVTGVDRTPAGYRVYQPTQLELLRSVRRARGLGLSLDEIRRLVELGRRGEPACATVVEVLERHARAADRQIGDLERRREALRALLDRARDQAADGDSVRLCRLTATED